MGGDGKTESVTRTTGLVGKPTPTNVASIGVSISGTPLTVIVQTPNGGAINDVEVEIWNLRKEKTGANSNKVTFKILNSEYDERVAPQGNKINIKVRKAHYGPANATGGTAVTPGEASEDVDFTKGTPLTVTMQLQDAGLARYTDTYDAIACRDLTRRQARDALLCLHAQGRIRLYPEPTFNHTTANVCDANCKLTSPLVGQRVNMMPKVGDVDYLYVGVIPETNDQVASRGQSLNLEQLDVRNGVGLYRLGQLLHDNYFASTIYHSGISGGGGRTDCHGQGRAIDFDGAAGNKGTVTVYNDWGKMQVFDMNDPETDPNLKRRLAKGQPWPYVSETLMYRLDPVPPGGRDLARRVFQDVYNWAVTQYSDKTANSPQTTPASRIGEGGRVMNADHHDSDKDGKNGREAHDGHMHMQIGETGTEPDPTIEPEP
jgi:hypothetical protein